MSEIEMLSAVNTNLGERESALTRSLSLLEHEREIVRRQLGLVAELLTLECQRVAAQAGDAPENDARVATEPAPVEQSAAEPEPTPPPGVLVEDDPKWETRQNAQPNSVPETAVETVPEARPTEPWAQVDEPEAGLPAAATADVASTEAQLDGEPELADGHNGDLLWRIEQLRRLRANLIVAAPAGPDDTGLAR
jgi:hypothetical protein